MLVAGAALLLVMTIGVLDVGFRYLANAPFVWSYDFISMYLMTAIFYLALSYTLRRHGHVSVDILHNRMSRRQRHLALVPGAVGSLLAFALMTSVAGAKAVESLVAGEVIVGVIYWPTWISLGLVWIGLALTLLRLLVASAGHLASAVLGVDLVELPPVSGQNESV